MKNFIPNLPDNRKPVLDEHGNERCDVGKEVVVVSRGGAFLRKKGKVVDGPIQWVIEGVRKVVKKKSGKDRIDYEPTFWVTVPYWLIKLPDRYFLFTYDELTFFE